MTKAQKTTNGFNLESKEKNQDSIDKKNKQREKALKEKNQKSVEEYQKIYR
tara:strand:- start:283 stop:435 length:153 start_codon:yes stop_codon:yes gene_type:complete